MKIEIKSYNRKLPRGVMRWLLDGEEVAARRDWLGAGIIWEGTGEYPLPLIDGHLEYIPEEDEILPMLPGQEVMSMPWGPFGRQAPYVEPKQAIVPSPIEGQFWSAYMRLNPRELRGLIPQYRVGPFRIDFALPKHKFGIELDGLRDHASTEAMAHDRARERYLMRQGWIIIRFGGAEVHKDAISCVREAASLVGHVRKVRR